MIARVQFALCVHVYTHTRAEIFIAARAAATDARKVLQIRGGWAFATAIIGSTLMHAM